MSDQVIHHSVCGCGRTLYASSIRLGLDSCGFCRRRAKNPAKSALKAKRIEFGHHIGVVASNFINERLSTSESQ